VQFPAEISNITTLKKGMKIVLAVADENVRQVMKDCYNFMDKPLLVTIDVDAGEQLERLGQISEEQRKKIYALLKDIASYMGETLDNTKHLLKGMFASEKEIEDFSLSNCPSETASDFIEYLISFAFENGIPLKESPKDYLDDIETYLRMCIANRMCAVCGGSGEVHHCEGSRIGMGRDRRKVDDSRAYKICLCREHHSELHTMSESECMEKYQVVGVMV
jgi:hypothetical protein